MAGTPRLRLVKRSVTSSSGSSDLGKEGDPRDLALTGTIFVVLLLPVLGTVVHVGRWSQKEIGLGIAGSLLSGRALWVCAKAALLVRRRRLARTPDPSSAERSDGAI